MKNFLKEFYAAALAIMTVISTIVAVISGIGFFTNTENSTALYIFVPTLLVAVIGLVKCYKVPGCREWLFGWLFPW
jgi:hypothetical protein